MASNSYTIQLNEKVARIEGLLAPFESPSLSVFASAESHYRQRAEFRVWHDGDDLYHIMFDQASKKPYRVDEFTPASLTINQAMRALIEKVKQSEILRRKLFQVDYLSGLSGSLVISLLYHKPLDDTWIAAAEQLQTQLREEFDVSLIGRARKQKHVLDKDYIIETLPIDDRLYRFMHIENSFTQPNADVNIQMIKWAKSCVANLTGDLLEFYCGAGNFSLPLAEDFNAVVGTEIAKPSVHAAQYNIDANQINNVTIVRLAAEEFVAALAGERTFNRLEGLDLTQFNFTTVLVDPPRSGLDAKTLQYVQDFDNIIYISCNPETLAANLEELSKTHTIKQAALFDQFPFTHHIESGVFLVRK